VQIDGSRVLLTGASGGLGQAIARGLAARGARLTLTSRRLDLLETLAGELDARVVAADLSSSTEVARLAADAGEVDVFVANAGIPGAGRLETFSLEEVDRVLDVNLRSAIVLTHALLPGMLERQRGQLVFVSSIAGKTTVPGDPLYHATKYGLRGFAAAMRMDLHGTGVGSSCIFPGFIRDAGIFADAGVKLPPGVGTRTPEDVAGAVVAAIERDRGEIEVAALPQRAGARVANMAPDFSAAMVRRTVGGRIAREMDVALRHKR
jgi:short-subunit dehydrogenase